MSKSHLFELSALEAPSDHKVQSDKYLVIFPLFLDKRKPNVGLMKAYTTSACHARESWVKYTDSHDIAMKFYVERDATDTVVPLLEYNGYDEGDILYFTPSDSDRSVMVKKCNFWNDPQLAGFEWVVQVDADMFIGSRQNTRLDFFGKLKTSQPEIGVLRTKIDSDFSRLGRLHYRGRNIVDQINASPEDAREWALRELENIEELAGTAAYRRYIQDYPMIVDVKCAVTTYPARHFHTNRNGDVGWLRSASSLLQDDEKVLILWHVLGLNIQNLSARFKVPVCWWYVEPDASSPYFSHVGSLGQMNIWKKDAGIL